MVELLSDAMAVGNGERDRATAIARDVIDAKFDRIHNRFDLSPMRLVVDANILFAALLRDGGTRRLMLSDRVVLFAPEQLVAEFEKYFHERNLYEKVGLSKEAAKDLFAILNAQITIVSIDTYGTYLSTVDVSDDKDRPYVATALACGIPIWSDDADLRNDTAVTVYTTSDLIERLL